MVYIYYLKHDSASCIVYPFPDQLQVYTKM
jgi:hypothetical protein